jgi:hypothetical protein
MISGSYCCEAVKFELTVEPVMIGTCHCSRFRKVGASKLVFVEKDTLRWVQGRDRIKVYEPVTPFKYARCFCEICSTPLGEILSDEDSFPISANLLDGGLKLQNKCHELVAEKPDWHDICDGAEQFDRHPVSS